tara:strand:+ start:352 stop:633 length:282 start_codon:yes stop_codon:yes gene_type:complete
MKDQTHSQKYLEVYFSQLEDVINSPYGKTARQCAKAVALLTDIFQANGTQIERSNSGDDEGRNLSATVQKNNAMELIGLLTTFMNPLDKHDGS